jgi:hypothetical protein
MEKACGSKGLAWTSACGTRMVSIHPANAFKAVA